MTTMRWTAVVTVMLSVVSLDAPPATAQTPDLTQLSLEDLLNTEITSVSRKQQTLSRTAAAVYVITQEDIRRSGAKTIPDLLRMVPGFSVAQIDATTWAVSARGFNGIYANKLLVLVDGRSVYSPMFGGVHWELQNLPLANIDRIEVVRGPGGTLWGTNAVNGIINILTKPADETPGGYVSVGSGTLQHLVEARFGGHLGNRAHFRVFGKHSTRTPSTASVGTSDPDGGKADLGGARFDWRGETTTLVVHGSVEDARTRHLYSEALPSPPWSLEKVTPLNYRDAYVLLSWTRSASSRSETGIQTYYQRYERNTDLRERWHVIDVDSRQRLALGRRHELVAGIGYRFGSVVLSNTPILSIVPADERTHLFTGFIQDEIEIARNIRLTPGTKVEHNSFSGFELQPSIRATWAPTPQRAVWGALSRAVRTPSKLDRGLRVTADAIPGFGGVPMIVVIEGNPELRSEHVEALEFGYRVQRGPASLDVTVFRNSYDWLKGLQPGAPTPGTYQGRAVRFLPLRFANLTDAIATGAELAMTWQPWIWWKVSGSYAWLQVEARRRSEGTATTTEGPVPEHQFHLRTYVDLPGRVEASALFYAGSGIPQLDVEPYRKLDTRWTWRPTRPIELTLTLQNVLHGGHREFVDVAAPVTVPVKKAVSGEVAWRF